MVLDAMSALSLAATIVQFVDFSSKVVSKGCHLYKSPDGALPENEQLRFMITDLRDLNRRLQHHETLGRLTKDERALEDLSSRCEEIGTELLGKLATLQVANEAKFRKWKSFRQGLKTVWSKEGLDKMAASLSDYRSQLELHILLSLRERNDLLAIQHTKQFEVLDARTKEIVRLLQKNQSPFKDELRVGGIVIAGFHQETQQHITSEHMKTRAELVQEITSLRDSPTIRQGQRQSRNPKDEAAKHRVAVEHDILDSLSFSRMNNRYHGIDDAHVKTFDWIFHPPTSETPPWSDFSEWLLKGDGIYWINGKAGSGKSTLMRYIYEDDRTQSLLKEWASPAGHLLTAAFFFWKSGSTEQASQTGLLRSLLFTLLEQRRYLIQAVFPTEWKLFEQEIPPTWTARQLRMGLKTFFQLDVGARVCIFIDGLDEYDGDPADTIHLFKNITSSRVKICLSSRPWVEFDDAFKNGPSLRLQDLTFADIELYIDEILATDERMIEFAKRCPKQAGAFTTEIITKAHGVFLWVKLVVRSLVNGLMNGDQIEELEKRLKELPSDLESLYAFMFAAISPRYLAEGSKIFQMMHAMQGLKLLPVADHGTTDLSAISLSFALEDNNALIQIPMKTLTSSEVARRVQIADKRLKVCCAGLLELSGTARRAQWEFGYLETACEPEILPATEVAHQQVDYIHRTAKDFLDTIRDRLLQLTLGTNFNPYTSLLRSSIMQLKAYYPVPACQADFDTLLSKPMALAHFAEKEQHKPSIELIDEFAKVFSLLRPTLGEPSQYKMLEENWPTDFLVVAVRSSLFSYLTLKFSLPSRIPKSPCGHSYLYYALKKPSKTSVIHSAETIQFLLAHSSWEDIGEGWGILLDCITDLIDKRALRVLEQEQAAHEAQLWLSTVRLFQEHGADPKVGRKVVGEGEILYLLSHLDGGSHDETSETRMVPAMLTLAEGQELPKCDTSPIQPRLLMPSEREEASKGDTSTSRPRNWLKWLSLSSRRKSSPKMVAQHGNQ